MEPSHKVYRNVFSKKSVGFTSELTAETIDAFCTFEKCGQKEKYEMKIMLMAQELQRLNQCLVDLKAENIGLKQELN